MCHFSESVAMKCPLAPYVCTHQPQPRSPAVGTSSAGHVSFTISPWVKRPGVSVLFVMALFTRRISRGETILIKSCIFLKCYFYTANLLCKLQRCCYGNTSICNWWYHYDATYEKRERCSGSTAQIPVDECGSACLHQRWVYLNPGGWNPVPNCDQDLCRDNLPWQCHAVTLKYTRLQNMGLSSWNA